MVVGDITHVPERPRAFHDICGGPETGVWNRNGVLSTILGICGRRNIRLPWGRSTRTVRPWSDIDSVFWAASSRVWSDLHPQHWNFESVPYFSPRAMVYNRVLITRMWISVQYEVLKINSDPWNKSYNLKIHFKRGISRIWVHCVSHQQYTMFIISECCSVLLPMYSNLFERDLADALLKIYDDLSELRIPNGITDQ